MECRELFRAGDEKCRALRCDVMTSSTDLDGKALVCAEVSWRRDMPWIVVKRADFEYREALR